MTASLIDKEIATKTLFSPVRDMSDYENLVERKYSNAPALESYVQPCQAGKVMPALDSYESVETKVRKSPEIAVNLEPYAVATTKSETTFRPKIFDTNLEEIDFNTRGLPLKHEQPAETVAREPIHLADFLVDDKAAPAAVAEKTEEPVKEKEYVTRFKLNAIGLTAIISFIAVVVLVLAFIIVNSVSISGNNAKISRLKTQNRELAATLSEQQNQSALVYQQMGDYIEQMVTDPVNGYSNDIEVITVSPDVWMPAGNADYHTNFFDQICNFFSRLFG